MRRVTVSDYVALDVRRIEQLFESAVSSFQTFSTREGFVELDEYSLEEVTDVRRGLATALPNPQSGMEEGLNEHSATLEPRLKANSHLLVILIGIQLLYVGSLEAKLLIDVLADRGLETGRKLSAFFYEFLRTFTDNMVIRFEPFLRFRQHGQADPHLALMIGSIMLVLTGFRCARVRLSSPPAVPGT